MQLSDLQPLLGQLPALAGVTGLTVAGRKVIARVVTGFSDALMIPIDDFIQTAKDKREGRSIASKALAEAIGKAAGADAELVQRAIAVQFGEATRKQKAREKVAAVAIDEYISAIPPHESDKDPAIGAEIGENEVDEDWLNTFCGYAERASSETMQRLWGKVLSGEMHKPGNFSLQALRVLSEMTPPVAELFRRALDSTLGGRFFPSDEIGVGDLVRLEAAGLVTGATAGGLVFMLEANALQFTMIAKGKRYAVAAKSAKPANISYIPLAAPGIELMSLADGGDELEVSKRIVKIVKKESSEAEIHLIEHDGANAVQLLGTY